MGRMRRGTTRMKFWMRIPLWYIRPPSHSPPRWMKFQPPEGGGLRLVMLHCHPETRLPHPMPFLTLRLPRVPKGLIPNLPQTPVTKITKITKIAKITKVTRMHLTPDRHTITLIPPKETQKFSKMAKFLFFKLPEKFSSPDPHWRRL